MPALAGSLPSHDDICISVQQAGKKIRVVSKERLAKAFLKNNDAASKLYIDVESVNPDVGPKWRAILIDQHFCDTDAACKVDKNASEAALVQLRSEAFETIRSETKRGTLYVTDDPKIGMKYFRGSDLENPIYCKGDDPAPRPKPYVIKMPDGLRMRGNSGDLAIRSSQEAFINASPATITFTNDGIQKSDAVKLRAAIGYAMPLPLEGFTSESVDYFGELVPYISADQSVTKKSGSATTYAETNSVAVGALLNSQATFDDLVGVNHVFSAKPQYLWNTRDKSEIASLRLAYAPWTVVGLNINTPNQIGNIAGATWLTLLFDLRANIGEYTKVASDPVTAMMQTSFGRAGSRFGFAIATDTSGPHIVLKMTQTMLYGFAGSERRINLFDSSLSYYFDKTSNFAFTVSYRKGQNEDTAEWAQTWTAGLSAKF